MKRTVCVLVLCLAAGAADAPIFWTPEFAMQFQNVGAVTPSPDGRLVAYTQTKAVMEGERSEMVAQIYLAKADGSHRVRLTNGEKSSRLPSFSPDGRFVYFLSARSGKDNLYRIPVDGGEAEMMTDWKGTIGGYAVAPDGKSVAFAAYETPADEEKTKKEKRDWDVVDEKPKRQALCLIPAEADENGKRAVKKLASGDYHVVELDWSPDSRSLAYSHQPLPQADYWTKLDISEVEVESGKIKALAATGAAESGPHYSPDGKYIVYEKTSEPPRWAGDVRLALLARQGGAVRVLPASQDERPQVLGWASDSSRVLFQEARRTRSAVYAMPVDGPPSVVFEPERGVLSGPSVNLNAKGTHLGFARESSAEAVEAFVLALGTARPVQVSRANSALPKLPLGETQVIKWKSKDGLEVEGLLTYPVGYEKGKKVPLILNIHGGPAGVFSETFIGKGGIYPLATFSAKGYAVLRCNIRGSGGYGKQFRFSNVNDWGGKDYEDLMAGVDHVIALGVADPDKMGVMGWSYGGFMTSWVVTQTNRFKAAAVGAGVTNLWSFTGTADIPGFLPDYFGGEPWDAFENYRKHSPMTFVKNVTTPTLVLHGEADERVPISQGYEFYNAIKRRGVTAKMVVYPRTPHGPTEPKFMLDIMNRHLDWVEKYVR